MLNGSGFNDGHDRFKARNTSYRFGHQLKKEACNMRKRAVTLFTLFLVLIVWNTAWADDFLVIAAGKRA